MEDRAALSMPKIDAAILSSIQNIHESRPSVNRKGLGRCRKSGKNAHETFSGQCAFLSNADALLRRRRRSILWLRPDGELGKGTEVYI
jgi:hypothetical protein